jgi:serine/threonine-protein kinase RsbT
MPLVRIRHNTDIVLACQKGRTLAAQLGLLGNEQTAVAIAISEVGQNILQHACQGEIVLDTVQEGERHGLAVVARDRGPGIADVAQAMQDGYSTSGGLGLGLPGAMRLMDDFGIASQVDRGTTVTMRKWKQ